MIDLFLVCTLVLMADKWWCIKTCLLLNALADCGWSIYWGGGGCYLGALNYGSDRDAQQLKTRDHSVSDCFSEKGVHLVRKQKRGVKEKQFLHKAQIWTHICQKFWKKMMKCCQKGIIWWVIVKNWLWIIKKKKGHWVRLSQKKG